MITTETDLVLPRGEVYFDRFRPGTRTGDGEIYLGNTPGFSVSRDQEEVGRMESYAGMKVAQESHVLRDVMSASITTDNINVDNMGLWLGTEPVSGLAGLSTVTESFVIKRGRFYQLGMEQAPYGVFHVVSDIEFRRAGVLLNQAANFTLFLDDGRFQVRSDAAISDGDTIVVSFQWRSSAAVRLHSSAVELTGSLRFIARNPVGAQKHCFFPFVRLKPSGQLDFKSDQWQQVVFEAEIRRLSPRTEMFYLHQTATAGYSRDEQGIIDHGGIPLSDFPYWEDQLNVIINTDLPAIT